MISNPIRGKTLTFTFEDGPMAGKIFEHSFAPDGNVSWRCTNGTEHGVDHYEVARVNDDVYAVAYLGSAGVTLTTVLDLERNSLVSFASSEKQLIVQHGTFQSARRAA